ncbi:FtsX-like permease family protein [Janthinobacterium sp. PLB04]|uniref:FtsX-like permease family protein n=1 Tax=Janthinobacterium lividum TaxID=29581 RepID=A0AAJ4T3W8_9BURK|nr:MULTISPECIES: FtsX-like permease family protein [Janthinobacterium]KAB0325446.1 FtsX-like permease family protein [Janthinobacterium lividum]QSX94547.1 FtsX-like permease family protein [Janthinobacterium lividum]UGQ34359.1 FtsX-like permease family protein [Janthinobacterium sp. PLB04]
MPELIAPLASPATTRLLSRWLLLGEWRAHPVRALVAILAIAIGVSLGFAIHLINAAAFNEFSTAVKSLSGQADVQVAGREALFDESIYPWLAQRDGVAVASPVLELQATVAGKKEGGPLHILALDVFRAGFISPDLIGAPAEGQPFDTLADDALFLSPAALRWLNVAEGGQVALQSGTGTVSLRVAGSLQRARAGQRIAVMDIGAAQWRFEKTGKLSRIDLKLRQGVNRDAFQAALSRALEAQYPGRFQVGQPNDENQNSRNNNLSRAYRVNLTVLALVALFTGAFLVFSTQALSVIRRRGQFALLRVLGMERGQLLRQVLLEGASLGIVGAALGIAGGYAMAAVALRFFGGDLGAGYFAGVQPQVQFTPVAAFVYFALGLGVALLGCAAPALEAARAAPAIALKSGSEEVVTTRLAKTWPALACLLLAGALTFLPPVFELPLFGYLSIALLLIGAIALMPQLAAVVFRFLQRAWLRTETSLHAPVRSLTLARLANASGQAGIALGGVLSSFSLMVAMAIMVSSFRVSVDDWLLQILPADVYARTAASGGTAGLNPREQASITALPEVARVDFQRVRSLSLAADRPNVALLARPVNLADPGKSMVLVGDTLPVPAGSRPVWLSEAAADLYNVKPGQPIALPLAGGLHTFFVAGIWRDYARSSGAIQMPLDDYRALTGDLDVSDAALWLAKDATGDALQQRLKNLPFGASLEVSNPSAIRALSLQIFDRSFAVTYLLEAIAIVIGLFGVAATFSAQTLARAREFGMLRHVGVTRGQILSILALEGGALTALGIATGFILGLLISFVLVFIVNPQSFHWTMQLHLPWPLIATVAGALLTAAAATALIAGRQALSAGPIRAVREDW